MKEPLDALKSWPLPNTLTPADDGLINRTFFVGPGPDAVLQWVNPIFTPEIQYDIEILTRRLADQGLVTPRLLGTHDGELWLRDDPGFWRAMTYIPGRTFHQLSSPAQALAAGRLMGQFHRATQDWQPTLRTPLRTVHHTLDRMADLTKALDDCDGHPLAGPARKLGQQIFQDWSRWDGALDLPLRFCHGDPKISNLRFDDSGIRGICLVDLDTIGPQNLSVEMGDAWRSWCNPAGEKDPQQCHFDLELFQASAEGWRSEVGPISHDELESIVPGIERICLELAARFCTDVVKNCYFREDRELFPQPGSHNLVKAESQLNLARSARDQRSRCRRILAGAIP